jgi:hypothetical protein
MANDMGAPAITSGFERRRWLNHLGLSLFYDSQWIFVAPRASR